MWKILLELPVSVQLGLMAISLFIGLWIVVIPFFILMNIGHAIYLFLTPWKPSEDFDDNDDDFL